jgi:predicted O-methyltransferase YrrM
MAIEIRARARTSLLKGNTMSRSNLFMSDQLYSYYLESSLREHPVLAELRAETAKMSNSQMQIGPEEGQFLALLVKLIGAKRTLDIGVFTGYSSLAVALALPENGQVIGCDINEQWTETAKKYWEKAGVAHKIQLKLGQASATLENLLDEGDENSFDFIFIDADKKNYPTYYELSLKLLTAGGLIAVDNVFQGGRVADPNVNDGTTVAIRDFNQKVLTDNRVELAMLPIADGLTLIRKI